MPLPPEPRYRLRSTIREHRLRAGMTQTDLGCHAGLTQMQVYRLEVLDVTNVRLVTLVRIADALGCRLDDLIRVERTLVPSE